MISPIFQFQHTLNIFFNNRKEGRRGGGGVNLRKISEKTTLKTPALLGLDFMGFTDLFYKEISFDFL